MITDLPTERMEVFFTVTNLSLSFTYKMAAKIKWHRYERELGHRHPMYT